IGAGNIGSIVCARAIGLKMHVIAYDPFLSKERAEEMGVVKVELDELLAQADFISLHVPLTDKTRNILNAEAIAKAKPGVRIINCARGGLVDEKALAEALKAGHVAGAGFDVFEVEPATESPLFGLPNVVCTPHLGASTTEAQENVALQVAEQMSEYLVKGAVTNAINMPSITAEEAPILKPFIRLADVLGAFVGQVTESAIKEIEILYDGSTAAMNTKALTSAALAGLIRPQVADVNMVSAPVMVKEKGVILSEVKRDKTGVFDGYIKLTVKTANQTRSVAGTVFSDGKPRFIQIKGINLDADVGNHMVYITNTDVPGMIGFIGSTLGDAGVNIANFQLGREKQGGDAIALLYVDGPVSEIVLDKLRANEAIRQAKPLVFNID
ncbi:phosphoglycerate dehydrogenase, partial [Sinorhizobium meliloti]